MSSQQWTDSTRFGALGDHFAARRVQRGDADVRRGWTDVELHHRSRPLAGRRLSSTPRRGNRVRHPSARATKYRGHPRTGLEPPEIWLRRNFDLAAFPLRSTFGFFTTGHRGLHQWQPRLRGTVLDGYPSPRRRSSAWTRWWWASNSVAVHCRQNADQSFGPFIDVGFGRLTWR